MLYKGETTFWRKRVKLQAHTHVEIIIIIIITKYIYVLHNIIYI
jgi:hypothetical protein